MAFAVRIHRFWQQYEPEKDPAKIAEGETHRAIDWVEYEPLGGEPGRSVNRSRIRDLERARPVEPGSNDLAAMAAQARWAFIKERYEAWKAGHDLTVNGTAFAAWPGITPEQAEVMRSAGLRTVEELAEAPDAVISRVRIPMVRELQENAKRFLASADRQSVSAELAQKDKEIAALKAQMAELAELVKGGAVKPAEDEGLPNKPVNECSDAELKTLIKSLTGEGVRGNPSRETLLARVSELVVQPKAA